MLYTKNMKTLLDRLISQLDTLIPFIATSHRDVFDLIQKEKNIWFNDDQEKLPKTYEIYRKQINHSAFILGYSYFEAFMNDLAKEIFLSRPSMLASNKTIKFEDVTNSSSYNEIILKMINKELLELFYKDMEDIIDYFSHKFDSKFLDGEKERLIEASLLRNCIIHNLGMADVRLAMLADYTEGKEFEISAPKVHDFGISARTTARRIYQQALDKHINNV